MQWGIKIKYTLFVNAQHLYICFKFVSIDSSNFYSLIIVLEILLDKMITKMHATLFVNEFSSKFFMKLMKPTFVTLLRIV